LKKLKSEQDRKDKEKFKNLFVDVEKFYADLLLEIEGIIKDETDLLANTANIASILHEKLNKLKNNKVNWTGFYWLHRDGQLVLATFQGKVACTRIGKGKGVCGTAVEKKQTQLVPDVHKFEGHIACDSDSNSEIVVPIIVKGNVVGVLDIDSIVTDGFDQKDQSGLEKIVHHMELNCDWAQLRRHLSVPLDNKRREPNNRIYIFLALGGIGFVAAFLGVTFFFSSISSSQNRSSSPTPIVRTITDKSDAYLRFK